MPCRWGLTARSAHQSSSRLTTPVPLQALPLRSCRARLTTCIRMYDCDSTAESSPDWPSWLVSAMIVRNKKSHVHRETLILLTEVRTHLPTPRDAVIRPPRMRTIRVMSCSCYASSIISLCSSGRPSEDAPAQRLTTAQTSTVKNSRRQYATDYSD